MTDTPVRVLFVAHSFPRERGDVAGAFILRLAVALRATGVDASVLAPAAAGLAASDTIDGVPVERFRYAPRAWETLAYAGTMAEQVRGSVRGKLALAGLVAAARRAIARAGAEARFDVVHAHWWFPLGVSAALSHAARPLVVTLHGSDVRLAATSALAPRGYRFVARRAAAVTTVSSWLAAQARTFAPDVNVEVAPMPADVGLFSPGAAQRSRAVLFVGRLNAQKGVRDLVRALVGIGDDVTLDVVGEGPDRAALEQEAQAAGVANRVRWHGALPQSAVAPLYQRAAVVAIPSRDEGLGLVGVEALLTETPVVAYRSGGLTDVVTDGRTGRLVAPGDTAALAAAMRDVIAAPERARAMGAAGRADMLARFSPEAAAGRYADIYRRARR